MPTPILHNGHLYFIHENLSIAYCVDATTGETVYEERIPSRFAGVYASPFVANDRIYYLSRNGGCVVLSAAPRFEVLARNELPRDAGVYNSSPTPMDNQILIRVEDSLFCIGE